MSKLIRRFEVRPRREPWQASFHVPGDKSISHRVAILAGLAGGVTKVTGFLPSDDCLCTLAAMEAMGAEVDCSASDDPTRPETLTIRGVAGEIKAPGALVDCGNSGTAMRLLSGVLAARPFRSEMAGDLSLNSRPMRRIALPLEGMGAQVAGQGENCKPPLVIEGADLRPITYDMPVASAQVKSCILLAGMNTHGRTVVRQPEVTRDHTERLFTHFGVPISVNGLEVSIEGPVVPVARDVTVPGDVSSAAFWMVAAAARPGARLELKGVGLNPTRTGVVRVLKSMGASVDVQVDGGEDGEPYGSIRIEGRPLQGTTIAGAQIPNVIDEIPVLAVAGALATGVTEIRDAGELRVKESDRIREVVTRLRAMGADVEEFQDGMRITGGRQLTGAEIESHGDHRIAMAFAIAGLFADGITQINDTACIDTSYPGFEDQLARI